jgi:hypothetical protein
MMRYLEGLRIRLAAWVAPRVYDRLVARMIDELARHIAETLLPEVQRRAEAAVEARLRAEMASKPLLGSELYLPGAVAAGSQSDEYMAASTPLTRDFLHPKFAEFARLYGLPFSLHRKHWEWAFIYNRLERAGMLRPGKKGLGFGVGRERLPALFARSGVVVTATDTADADQHWRDSGQYGGSREHLFDPNIISRELFDERVSFEPCDMSNINPRLSGYDFCWSSCCFEHLGDLQKGLDFVVNSVERTLVVGGIACHTTEFNLSSDEATIGSGLSVVYRKRDLLELCSRLEERGHMVEPLRIEPGGLLPDYLVDVPPYRDSPHLKLLLGEFVATSIGMVIRRGR